MFGAPIIGCFESGDEGRIATCAGRLRHAMFRAPVFIGTGNYSGGAMGGGIGGWLGSLSRFGIVLCLFAATSGDEHESEYEN
jgi:hypothetical protein